MLAKKIHFHLFSSCAKLCQSSCLPGFIVHATQATSALCQILNDVETAPIRHKLAPSLSKVCKCERLHICLYFSTRLFKRASSKCFRCVCRSACVRLRRRLEPRPCGVLECILNVCVFLCSTHRQHVWNLQLYPATTPLHSR